MPILSPAEAQSELARVTAIDDLEAGVTSYPYTRLSADDFERLLYALFKVSTPPNETRDWDDASLMLRGADAGRDVVLFANGVLKGVVQCKRLEGAITLPAIFRELAKLVLFSKADASLPPIKAGLQYFLALSKECTGPVIDFFNRPDHILKQKDSVIMAAVTEVLESYTSLKNISERSANALVRSALPSLKYHLIRPTLLDSWVSCELGVATRFFRHRILIDNTHLDERMGPITDLLALIQKQTQGVAFLTDADLKIIKDRIEHTPESHRVAAGFVSLFGFPRQMFIGDDRLRAYLQPLATVLNDLSAEFIDWIYRQAADEAAKICNLGQVIFTVHPFARQIPSGFLALVTRDVVARAVTGKVMSEMLSKLNKTPIFVTDEEHLEKIQKDLFAQGARYLKGDFSDLVGDDNLKALKRRVILASLQGLHSEDDIAQCLKSGLVAMNSHLIAAGSRIKELGAHQPCVFLGGAGMDNPQTLHRIAATVRGLEDLKKREGSN